MLTIAVLIGKARLRRRHQRENEQVLADARAAFVSESPRWAR